MTDQSTTPDVTGRNAKVFYVLCGLLILTFLWRAFVPAHEYPSRTVTYLEMAVDTLCLVGLIGLRKVNTGLFIVALICGIGLFGIRLHSTASWYTGHWHYSLSR